MPLVVFRAQVVSLSSTSNAGAFPPLIQVVSLYRSFLNTGDVSIYTDSISPDTNAYSLIKVAVSLNVSDVSHNTDSVFLITVAISLSIRVCLS